MSDPAVLWHPHTVTFDCWATLLYEVESTRARGARSRVFAEFAEVAELDAQIALKAAWHRHQLLWHRGVAFTGVHMTQLALEILGSPLDAAREGELIEILESQVLDNDVRAVDGAREALTLLAQQGVRR